MLWSKRILWAVCLKGTEQEEEAGEMRGSLDVVTAWGAMVSNSVAGPRELYWRRPSGPEWRPTVAGKALEVQKPHIHLAWTLCPGCLGNQHWSVQQLSQLWDGGAMERCCGETGRLELSFPFPTFAGESSMTWPLHLMNQKAEKHLATWLFWGPFSLSAKKKSSLWCGAGTSNETLCEIFYHKARLTN